MTRADLDAHVRRHTDPGDGLGCARGCCWAGPAAVAFWLAVVYFIVERIAR